MSEDEVKRPGSEPQATLARRLTVALDERKLTLVALQERLAARGHRVALSTLSYWRSGQRRPESPRSLDALDEIEDLLGLAPGWLRASLGPSRRARPDQLVPFDVQVGAPGDLEDFKRAVGEDDGLATRSVSIAVEVDADGWVVSSTSRTRWQARRDHVTSALVPLKLDQPVEVAPEVHALAGCTLGETYWEPATGLLAAELRLDRPLAAGESTMTEHAFTGRFGTEQDRHWAAVAPRRCHQVGLWVRFDPSRRPRRCRLEVWHEERTLVDRDLALVGSGVSHVEEGFGPGTVQITWEW